ncbi:MAG: sigma-70 family RNA polymerase sigma factor [Oscillibacter sp.]|nr:sigma-70 family RNA polymerase sigma factor [Oscillibacter sp.]
MEDAAIIQLYFDRNQEAIRETEGKYGGLCRRIARNILTIREDAEECVNDTYLAAWNTIPPQRPHALAAFLGRLVRNLSISRYRANRAQKRYDGMEALLSELEECVPARETVETELERAELGEIISLWLETLPQADQRLFLRRYWYGEAVRDLAQEAGLTPNQASQKLLRLRKALREVLEMKGAVP